MADQQAIVHTVFGSVYSDRVAFNSQKGWFSGGSMEELPIRHVTSVRIETSRNIMLGIALAFVGLICFAAKGAGIIVGLLFLALAALVFWGSPSVRVNTAGGDLRPARGFPWQRAEAEAYVSGVRKALFAKDEDRAA